MAAGKPINPLPLREFAKVDLKPFLDRINAWTREFVASIDSTPIKRNMVAAELVQAAERAVAKHGDQNHLPDGTGPDEIFEQNTSQETAANWALLAKYVTDKKAAAGKVTWFDILIEEIAEASEQDDLHALRAELKDSGAVILNWILAIDKRIEE